MIAGTLIFELSVLFCLSFQSHQIRCLVISWPHAATHGPLAWITLEPIWTQTPFKLHQHLSLIAVWLILCWLVCCESQNWFGQLCGSASPMRTAMWWRWLRIGRRLKGSCPDEQRHTEKQWGAARRTAAAGKAMTGCGRYTVDWQWWASNCVCVHTHVSIVVISWCGAVSDGLWTQCAAVVSWRGRGEEDSRKKKRQTKPKLPSMSGKSN